MVTIGEVIARVRNQYKATKQDAFMTDRFIYSMVMKHAKLLMRRQDSLNKLMKFNSIFQTLDFVELIDVDRAQAQCHGIDTGCYFKRTKEKLPALMEGYWGPLLRAVTSIDLSEDMTPTYPTSYEQMSKQKTFKYNKKKYYWYLNGYLYFPNIEWDAVRLEGVFEGDVSHYNCDPADNCMYVQDKEMHVPEYMFAEIESMLAKDMSLLLQIPQDPATDNRHIERP